jgi:Flp pilus assembly pilin Flp
LPDLLEHDMPIDREPKEPTLLARFAKDEQAASSVEYVLIAVIVAVPLLASLGAVQLQLSTMLTSVADVFITVLG